MGIIRGLSLEGIDLQRAIDRNERMTPNPSTLAAEETEYPFNILSPTNTGEIVLPTPSAQQQKAIDMIFDIQTSNTSTICFLTGKAGTGKSFTLKHLINRLNEAGVETAIAAPTGTAALNVDGVTIHNLLSFKPDHSLTNIHNHEPRKCRGLRTIIIDEVSMVRADMMDMIDIVLRNIGSSWAPFGGINIILVGDPAQLPPVVASTDARLIKKHYDSEFFFSSKVFKSCMEAGLVHFFCLTQPFRQADPSFISLLDNVRTNNVPTQDLALLNETAITKETDSVGTILTKSNRQKDLINQRALETLQTQSFTYEASIMGSLQAWQMNFSQKLTVKIGSRVMAIKNIYDGFGELIISNGDMGVVVEAGNDPWMDQNAGYVSVLLDRTRQVHVFTYLMWEEGYNEYDSTTHSTRFKRLATVTQIPLVLANAVTVHKAQGQTLENTTIDIREGMGESGMLYTAITRVKALPGLKTLGRYNKFSFGVNEETVKFLELVEERNLLD